MNYNNLEETSVGDKVAWKSGDGHISTSYRESARRHQDYVFKQFYNNNRVNRVSDEQLIKWLREHKQEVLTLLADIKGDIL